MIVLLVVGETRNRTTRFFFRPTLFISFVASSFCVRIYIYICVCVCEREREREREGGRERVKESVFYYCRFSDSR